MAKKAATSSFASILKKLAIGLALLIVVLVVIAFLLPRTYRVERSLVINAPQIPIYQLVAAPTNWQKWGVWNKRDPNMTMTYSGPAAEKGAKWSWKSKSEGDGDMEFTDADSPRRLVYQLIFPDMNMVSQGEFILTAQNDQVTKVTWTSEGDLGNNPISRYFGLFMDKMVGGDFETSLAALKTVSEQRFAEQKPVMQAAQDAATAAAAMPVDAAGVAAAALKAASAADSAAAAPASAPSAPAAPSAPTASKAAPAETRKP